MYVLTEPCSNKSLGAAIGLISWQGRTNSAILEVVPCPLQTQEHAKEPYWALTHLVTFWSLGAGAHLPLLVTNDTLLLRLSVTLARHPQSTTQVGQVLGFKQYFCPTNTIYALPEKPRWMQ